MRDGRRQLVMHFLNAADQTVNIVVEVRIGADRQTLAESQLAERLGKVAGLRH
jgi:hypothetical protein